MSLPAWPGNCPYKPTTDTFNVAQLTNPPLRTDMNAGTTRQRMKYTLRIQIQKISIVMSSAQYAYFEPFFVNDIAEGSARFVMPIYNAATDTFINRTVTISEGPTIVYHAPGYVKLILTLKIELAS